VYYFLVHWFEKQSFKVPEIVEMIDQLDLDHGGRDCPAEIEVMPILPEARIQNRYDPS
jgi:hypothetical protein